MFKPIRSPKPNQEYCACGCHQLMHLIPPNPLEIEPKKANYTINHRNNGCVQPALVVSSILSHRCGLARMYKHWVTIMKMEVELPVGEGSRWVLAGADRGVRLELWKEECCVKRGDSSSKLLLEVWSWLWVKIDSLSECSGSTSSSWNLDPAAGQKFTLVRATDQWRIGKNS